MDFDLYAHGNIEGAAHAARPLRLRTRTSSSARCFLSLIQLLWDRGEANGYAHHITSDPLPGTPAHNVLMHVAFGDHQVANVTAEVEARTIGRRFAGRRSRPDATPT